MDDLRQIWPEMHARHAQQPLACYGCCRVATCVGVFDDLAPDDSAHEALPACDKCCAHVASESGRCEPLAQPHPVDEQPTPFLDSLRPPPAHDDVTLAARSLHVTFCRQWCEQREAHERALAEGIQRAAEQLFPPDNDDDDNDATGVKKG